jgi:long-chain fatty acid transport protein
MPKFISSARFGLGLGTMADGYMVKVNDVDLRTHNWVNYGREAQRTVIMAGLGFGFLDDKFGFGVGANIWTGGEGAVLMKGVEVGSDEQSPDQQARMDLTTTAVPVAGIYVSIGKIVHALRGLDFGASYRGELYMSIDPFMAGTQLATGAANLQLMMSIFDYYTPHTFSAGFAYNLPMHNRLTVEIDVEYQMWSGYKVSEARRKYWEEGGFGSDVGGNPYFINVDLPEFRDVIVPKLGITYRIFDWVSAMTGYSYQQSYIPDDALTGIFNMMDNDRHIASLGFQFIIPRMGGMVSPLEIVVAGQYQMLVKRDVVKDYSYINLANSDAAIAEPNLKAANPDYSFGGSVWSATIEVKLRW